MGGSYSVLVIGGGPAAAILADTGITVFQEWQEKNIFQVLGVSRPALYRARKKRG